MRASSRFLRLVLPVLGLGCRQGWIKPRSRVLPLLNSRKFVVDYDFDISFEGLRYVGNLRFGHDWWVYFFGMNEPSVVGLLRDIAGYLKRIGNDVIFWDVGCNVGHHLLCLAHHIDRGWGFEPLPELFHSASRKVAANALAHLKLLPIGLGDSEGQLAYFKPISGNTGTGSFVRAGDDNSAEPLFLPVKGGDALVRSGTVAAPNMIKIDVEGFEPAVLAGLSATLQSCRPIIVFELSPDTRAHPAFAPDAIDTTFYPGCRLFYVDPDLRGRYSLTPFDHGTRFGIDNVLVLPPEHAMFASNELSALGNAEMVQDRSY
jgi:FkbM family methyltransferase